MIVIHVHGTLKTSCQLLTCTFIGNTYVHLSYKATTVTLNLGKATDTWLLQKIQISLAAFLRFCALRF